MVPITHVLQFNTRIYSEQTRKMILAALRRMSARSVWHRVYRGIPSSSLFNPFPLTDNDDAITQRIAHAFTDFREAGSADGPTGGQRELQRDPYRF